MCLLIKTRAIVMLKIELILITNHTSAFVFGSHSNENS